MFEKEEGALTIDVASGVSSQLILAGWTELEISEIISHLEMLNKPAEEFFF